MSGKTESSLWNKWTPEIACCKTVLSMRTVQSINHEKSHDVIQIVVHIEINI